MTSQMIEKMISNMNSIVYPRTCRFNGLARQRPDAREAGGRSVVRASSTARDLSEILGSQSGSLGDAREHLRPDLLPIVKREGEVRPT